MSQVSKKVQWCLNKAKRELKEKGLHRGLIKLESNQELAEKHLKKAEHNLKAAHYFEQGGFSDWSPSAFFYVIYHCFLAILRKFGYESRNQECTIAVIEMLKLTGKINIENKFIDTLKINTLEEIHQSTTIELRETFQYGIETKFEKTEEFKRLANLCQEIIEKTKNILFEMKENERNRS